MTDNSDKAAEHASIAEGYLAAAKRAVSAPIDRIENVRASVDDVERQMQACQAAGVMIPPTLAWRLLAECRSLLSLKMRAEIMDNV